MIVIQLIDSNGNANNVWQNLSKTSISKQLYMDELTRDYGGDYYFEYITFEDDEKASFFVLKFS
jgi:hypothetical protein